MQGLTEGRLVRYILPDGPSRGEARPAVVVRVWRDGDGKAPENGCSQLQVFTDGSNDGEPFGTKWATSVVYDASGAPGTWHWPPRA